MREHIGLYRGKRKDNGEWVQGTPFFARDCCKMIVAVAVHPDFVDEGNVYYAEGYPVDPDTVGECCGLTDKNGKLIFEGDIIRSWQGNVFEVQFGQHMDEEELLEACGWFVTGSYGTLSFGEDWGGHEIIGNIHENPELLGG